MIRRPYQLVERTNGPWDSFEAFSLLKQDPIHPGAWRLLYTKKDKKSNWRKALGKRVLWLTEKTPDFSEIRKQTFLTEEEFFAELL